MASKKFNYIFIDELSDKLKCSICLDVAEDPKQHEKCGKIFCSKCIEGNRTKPCPCCRGESPNYFTDMRGAQEIRDLRVKCCNLDNGCQWQGSVGILEEHLTTCNCEFVTCKYSYIGCDMKMSGKDIKQHEENDDKHHLHLALQSTATPILSHGEHYIFRMTGFSTKKRNKEVFLSDPFYTHSNGYRMCFNIYANGKGSGEGSHLSVSLCLLKGPFDKNLQWPFSGTVYFCILNPANNAFSDYIDFCYKNEPYGQPDMSWDEEEAISHASLSTYMKNDTIYFQVKVELSTNCWFEWGKQLSHKLVNLSKTFVDREPLVFKVNQYASFKHDSIGYSSRNFFTGPDGYKMYVDIYPDGEGEGKGKYISVFVNMIAGPHDANLSWPFLGTVKFELLNQSSNDHHHTKYLPINRDVNMCVGQSWGYFKLIRHSDLQCGVKQYLMNDSLYFSVSVTLDNAKPWLACTP